MSTPKSGSSRQHGPAGRKVGRAIFAFVGHTAAVFVLLVLGLYVASDRGPGTRDRLAYGRDNSGRMCMGGLPHNPIGNVEATTEIWRIRGVGGKIGLVAHGTTVRTGPGGVDEREFLAAADRLADYLDELRYIYPRAWCQQGPFMLFEPSEGIVRVLAATLAAAAATWAVLFISGRALFAFGRRQIANRIGRVRASKGRCAACGYSLDGLSQHACPECGKSP